MSDNFNEQPSREARVIDRFGALVHRLDAPWALRRMTLVGGDGRNSELGYDDAHYRIALEALNDLGIPLAPDFRIQIVNYDRDGRDFLVNPPETDLLITCFINNPPYRKASLSNSPHHYEPGIWWRKAVEAGARVICTNGVSPDEIGEDNFTGGPYVFLGYNLGLEDAHMNSGSTLVHQDYLTILRQHGRRAHVSHAPAHG